jgi:hypothetical protein
LTVTWVHVVSEEEGVSCTSSDLVSRSLSLARCSSEGVNRG